MRWVRPHSASPLKFEQILVQLNNNPLNKVLYHKTGIINGQFKFLNNPFITNLISKLLKSIKNS